MNTEKKLKLLLFGATRHTGWHVMLQALGAGHEVTAIIRNPDGFTYRHDNLNIVQGDALQLHTFESELVGKDAVISTLGINPADFRKPTVTCSQGVANMMVAMKKNGVERIMCVSALGLDTNPKIGFFQSFVLMILQRVLKNSYADLRAMEAELKASDLKWTIVRGPRLNDGDAKGRYRVAVGDHLTSPMSIRRADLADFLCKHITDANTYGKMVEVAY